MSGLRTDLTLAGARSLGQTDRRHTGATTTLAAIEMESVAIVAPKLLMAESVARTLTVAVDGAMASSQPVAEVTVKAKLQMANQPSKMM